MLIRALDEHADAALLVLSDAGTVTRGEVRDRATEIVRRAGDRFSGRAVGIGARPTFENVAWLAAAQRLGVLAVVLPARGWPAEAEGVPLSGMVGPCTDCGRGIWREQRERSTAGWLPCARPEMACSPDALDVGHNDPGLLLFHDRGGRVEATRHGWPELVERIRASGPVHGARWLLTEPISSFGGMHVLLEAILGRGAVCVPFPDEPERQLDAAAAAGITHVAGSPAFFRGALAGRSQRRTDWTPSHIAVGGAPVPADLLDDLRARFPAARLRSIREQRPTVTRRGSRW